MENIGIYIHVPFCAVKCPYCDFYSTSYNLNSVKEYTKAVIRDIKNLFGNLSADTVYFGGGTPSLLPPEFISDILSALQNSVTLDSPEITLEVNPCTVNEAKLRAYYQMGINRLSFGVQSAIDSELAMLGRKHTFEKAAEAVRTAQIIGFQNISCDLMTGLPKQTAENLAFSIKQLAALGIQHISSYILKIEENTPFNCDEIAMMMPDDDSVSDLYLFMVNELEKYGFMQYEISNFSKPGYESRHNLKYWQCRKYIGLGPAAHSYYDGKRYFIPPNLDEYIKSCRTVVTDDASGQDDEKIMLGLRLKKGINVSDFPDSKDYMTKKAELLQKSGLLTFENGIISLTPEGFLLSNSIINELIK